ncbi:MAG: hypothetical protein ABIA74_04285 [bacterium]
MFLIYRYINILFIFFLFFGCARKQKNIFDFSKKDKIKINKLSLPIPKNLDLEKKGEDIFLLWQDVKNDLYLNDDEYKITFVGYNIYRFVHSGFIPKNPLNKKPIKINNFCDKEIVKIQNNYCYLIRAVFEIQNKIIQGPASKIICIK